MNIIFLTMSRMTNISYHGIYGDLMRKFRDEGHNLYIVSPRERSLHQNTGMEEVDGVHILGVKTLNLQKTSVVEKGIGQVMVEYQFKNAIKRHLSNISFDLILYTTPPITFPEVIKFLHKQNPQAYTYLLLKDIFPQNAVDLGMMRKTGVKGLLYRFFRKKEKRLYALSDFIGCMSPANIKYVLRHNSEITPRKVEVAPNSMDLIEKTMENGQVKAEWYYIRKKYNLPTDKPVFIYGGNLGKPQGIPYLIDCLEANKDRIDCHFVVIGTGTELQKLKDWHYATKPSSVTVMDGLPKDEYELLVRTCDVGMIFLDHRFTIPNYPSRILSYLSNKMPVLCATDPNTDIGRIAEENGYGYWCESNSVDAFIAILEKMIQSNRQEMGEKGFQYFKENYLVDNTYNAIMNHLT